MKGEWLMTTTLTFLTIISAVGVFGGLIRGLILGIAQWVWLLYLLVIPIIIVFGIAPYKLWRQQKDTLVRLTTERLEVEIEKQPESAPSGHWWHLIVSNPNSIPIESCYGQLKSFEPNKNGRPYPPLRLPWSSLVTREMERYTIPAKGSGILDFVVITEQYLSVVALSIEEGKRIFFNYEPPGTYEAEIQVGSEKEDFKPTKIKLKMVFSGGMDISIEKIRDNG